MEENSPKVVKLIPNPRPLSHGKRELMAQRMGIHGDSPSEAYRYIFGLMDDEAVPSTAHNWSARQEVQERVKHLRMEEARRESDRVRVDRNKVIDELWQTYNAAAESENFAGRTKSLELLGKDAGMFKGSEAGKKTEDLTDEDLAAEFKRLMEEASGSGSEESPAGVGEGTEGAEAPELPTLPKAG